MSEYVGDFFFNDTATTEIYTLSLHDALSDLSASMETSGWKERFQIFARTTQDIRSEEHTSELQSRLHLVCRLLLEKKKQRDVAPPVYSRLPSDGSTASPWLVTTSRRLHR